MIGIERLSLGLRSPLSMVYQRESSECGLASLIMAIGYHRYHVSLEELRRRFPVSAKGLRVRDLVEIADQLDFFARAVRVEEGRIDALTVPSILHWNSKHFVVLARIRGHRVTIHDPARGVRTLSLEDARTAFTGIAIELSPKPTFHLQTEKPPTVRLRDLVGQVTGLYRSLGQILLFALAVEVLALLSPLFLQWIIDRVLVSADRDLLTTLGLGFALLALMQGAIFAAKQWSTMHMRTLFNFQWRANLFGQLLRLPLDYFSKRSFGDILTRFAGVDKIESTFTTAFIDGMFDGAISLAILVILIAYSPVLALVVVFAVALSVVSQLLFFHAQMEARRAETIKSAAQQTYFLESIRAVRAIKLFRGATDRHTRWLNLLIDQVNTGLYGQKLLILHRTVRSLVFGLENVAVLWLGTWLVIDGRMSSGALIAFFAYQMRFVARVPALIERLLQLRMLGVETERLADIVLAQAESQDQSQLPVSLRSITPSIEVRNVSFRYGFQEEYVLKDVSFKVEAGESIVITGPSGGGKTTLTNILIGVLPIQEGEVLFQGESIRRIGIQNVRNLVGVVMQDDVLLAGSIADNITFFDPEPDLEWMMECARLASIHEEIACLPTAYHCYVGDMGNILSGGQKQRLLLARALYKRPRILVLDEATSHMDSENERRVNTAIQTLSLTRVIVAHRPETVRSAARYMILSRGRVERDVRLAADPVGERIVLGNAHELLP